MPVELHLVLRRVVLLGTPLTLAILEFFHPLVSRCESQSTKQPELRFRALLNEGVPEVELALG